MNRTVADRCIHEFDLIPRDENYFCVPNRLDNCCVVGPDAQK